jgi:YD repeat-containing protein
MKSVLLFLVFAILSFSSWAGVSLKNGNFFISYTDILVPGHGHDLEITRTYNSKSTHEGWFGFGWGSDFETYLTVEADGSVTILENGGGAQTRFLPKGAVDPKSAAKKIVSAIKKKNKKMSKKLAKNLEKKLIKDAELRRMYSRRYSVSSKIAKGTKLYSNIRGMQTLVKTKEGFTRKFNSGKVEVFNDKGQLVSVKDKHNYKINFKYKNGRLISLKDSYAKQLFFEWYSSGKIKSVRGGDTKKAKYTFDDNKLAETTDVNGNNYKYAYDRNYNLTQIAYSDKTKMTVKYTPKTQFVSEVVDRSGVSTKYSYGSNPKMPKLHYWTTVSKKRASGKVVKNKYEYLIKLRKDGSQYIKKIITDIAGLKTTTEYNDLSLPLFIKRGKHTTNFKYSSTGLLLEKKSSRGEFVKISYDKVHNKIAKVVNNDGWTKFQYNKAGNLQRAQSSKGKSVLLKYDRKGQITTMEDRSKKGKTRKLSFKYNAQGKPIEISMNKVGKINVAYDNAGEIKRVDSKAGPKMAMQVTMAFQSLLSIVKPAGVNLNM